jgi:hypothetical protein
MPSFDENAIDVTVNLSLGQTTKHIWGQTLTENTDGALKMHGLDHITWNRLNVVAWLADGAETTFLFPTDKPATSDYATTFELWDYNAGTEVTAGITKSTTGVVYDSAPAASKLLIALYEY